MRLIITRHGETEQNKERILQGQTHGNLSELGKEQAIKVAKRLKNEQIDYIFSSPLARAKDTAEEIRKFHLEKPFELRNELKELHMGAFQGKSAPENFKETRWVKGFFKNTGGEEYEELVNRAKRFLEEIYPRLKDKNVLVVAHNGINQALITALLDKEWEYMKKIGYLENTSVTIFEFDEEGKPILKLINCSKHLEE